MRWLNDPSNPGTREVPPNPLVAADATRMISPPSSRLAPTYCGSARQPGRVAPLNSLSVGRGAAPNAQARR